MLFTFPHLQTLLSNIPPLSRMGRLPVSIVLKNIQQSLVVRRLTGGFQSPKSGSNSELAGHGSKILSRIAQTEGQQQWDTISTSPLDALKEVLDGRYHDKSFSGRG